jgi:hypothetical protein
MARVSEQASPARGPYFSTWGPHDGPVLRRDDPPALGVVAEPGGAWPIGIAEPGGAWPIGIAYPVGMVAHRRAPAATFRLVIDQVELEGRWVCVGREFVRLGEAAEELRLAHERAPACVTEDAPGLSRPLVPAGFADAGALATDPNTRVPQPRRGRRIGRHHRSLASPRPIGRGIYVSRPPPDQMADVRTLRVAPRALRAMLDALALPGSSIRVLCCHYHRA